MKRLVFHGWPPRALVSVGVAAVLFSFLLLPSRRAGAVPPSVKPKPPLPPAAQAEARQIGARLLRCYQAGALRLVRTERERRQLHQIAAQGYLSAADGRPVVVSLGLLRTLDRLAGRSTPRKPLGLLSLYRPLSATRSREPHGRGEAVDITAFGGYQIRSADRDECVNGVVSVIKALGPRAYRLGLPRPPGAPVVGLLPPPPRAKGWPFFPAPVPETVDLPLGLRVVRPHTNGSGRFARTRRGGIRPRVSRWENERYAPLRDIGSARVRRILAQARRRGVTVHGFFPDAADHLHLDVKPPP